jgi:predicted Zn-dependent protease
MSAYVEHRYLDAAGMFENVLAADPSNNTARFYLGVCRLLNGRPADAADALLTALQAPASALTQSEHYYLGKAYVQMGKLADGQHEMDAAAALPGRLKTAAELLAQRIEAFRKNQESPGNDR